MSKPSVISLNEGKSNSVARRNLGIVTTGGIVVGSVALAREFIMAASTSQSPTADEADVTADEADVTADEIIDVQPEDTAVAADHLVNDTEHERQAANDANIETPIVGKTDITTPTDEEPTTNVVSENMVTGDPESSTLNMSTDSTRNAQGGSEQETVGANTTDATEINDLTIVERGFFQTEDGNLLNGVLCIDDKNETYYIIDADNDGFLETLLNNEFMKMITDSDFGWSTEFVNSILQEDKADREEVVEPIDDPIEPVGSAADGEEVVEPVTDDIGASHQENISEEHIDEDDPERNAFFDGGRLAPASDEFAHNAQEDTYSYDS